jgi:PAS domain S-box-containing protein
MSDSGFFAALRRHLYALVVVCLGISLSGLAAWFYNYHLEDEKRLNFEWAANERLLAVKDGVEETTNALEDIASFYAGSKFVDRMEFREFTKPILKRQGGLQALEWIPRLTHEQRQEYEKKAQTDIPNFKITQRKQGKMVAADNRKEYFPVYYMEPFAGNETAMGFDLGSNPDRLAALQQAWESGKVAVSSPITLVQKAGSQIGLLFFHPVYTNNQPSDTIKQRRSNLHGFILGVYRMDSLIQSSIKHLTYRGVDFLLNDEYATKGKKRLHLHVSRKFRDNAEIHGGWSDNWDGKSLKRFLKISGRQWSFDARPNPQQQDIDEHREITPSMIFWGGILITLLLAGQLIRLKENITERNRAVAGLMTSESRFRSITQSSTDGIIAADAEGNITFWNQGAKTIFGHGDVEILGKPLTTLIPEQFHQAHNQGIKRVCATNKSKVVGKVLELVGRRKNGEEFPLEASISTWMVHEKRFFASIVRDISERKESEKRTLHLQEARETISDLLHISLRTTKLQNILEKALLLLVESSWLQFQKKGAIFVTIQLFRSAEGC